MQEEIDRIVDRLNADSKVAGVLATPAESGAVPTSKERTDFFIAIALAFKHGCLSSDVMQHFIRHAVHQVATCEALNRLHIIEFVLSLFDAEGGVGRAARIIVAREAFGEVENNLQVDYTVSQPIFGIKTIWYFDPHTII